MGVKLDNIADFLALDLLWMHKIDMLTSIHREAELDTANHF